MDARIATGHKGLVYRLLPLDTQTTQQPSLQSHLATAFALKVPARGGVGLEDSVARELQKSEALTGLGIPHSPVIEQGSDYALKEWISGERGDQWFRKWANEGLVPKTYPFVN